MIWNKYPNTNYHELDLDWILKKILELYSRVDTFEAVNKITYQGAWNILDAYPAWSVVTTIDQQSNVQGYLAIKPVPIGIDITNTEYWVWVADYTAQMADISQFIYDINNWTPTVDERLDNLYNRPNIVIIGDSYGTTNGSGLGTITPYPVFLQQYLHLDNNHYHTAHRNGAGFANGRYLERLQTLSDSNYVNEVYVFGGWNDTLSRVTDSDVFTGMEAFATEARSKFPNAKLYCGILAYGYDVSPTYLNDMAHLASTTYGECVKHGFDAYLNSFPICLQSFANFWYDISDSSGASHPSTTGSEIIAERLATLIQTKTCSFQDDYTVTYDSLGDFTLSDFNIHQSCDGKMVTTENTTASRFTLSSATPFTLNSINGGAYVNVAQIKNSLTMFRRYNTVWSCPARLSIDGQAGYTETSIEITLHNKLIQIRNCYGLVNNVTAIYACPRGTIALTPYNA